MSEICSKLTIKIPDQHRWYRSGIFIVNFKCILHICSGVSIVDFEQVNSGWDVFYLSRPYGTEAPLPQSRQNYNPGDVSFQLIIFVSVRLFRSIFKVTCAIQESFQQFFTCSRSTMETLQKVWNVLKVNNIGTKTKLLTSFWCLYCWLWTYFTPFLVLLLLTLNRWMFSEFLIYEKKYCRNTFSTDVSINRMSWLIWNEFENLDDTVGFLCQMFNHLNFCSVFIKLLQTSTVKPNCYKKFWLKLIYWRLCRVIKIEKLLLGKFSCLLFIFS